MIVPSFPRLSETFIVNKLLGLLDRGYDAHIVCHASEEREWRRFPQLTSRELRNRVHLTWPIAPRWRVPMSAVAAAWSIGGRELRVATRYARRAWKTFGLAAAKSLLLEARLLELEPELLHFEFGSAARQRIVIKDVIGARVIVSFRGHDLNFVGLDDPHHYESVWQRADAIHCLGEDLWRQAILRGCPPTMKHALISPAVDLARFSSLSPRDPGEVGTAGRPLRVICIGRLDWTKGYEYALSALRRVLDAGVACELRVIGGGEFRPAVEHARAQLGLGAEVQLLDALAPDAITQHLGWADVMLHLAVTEGFCNAVIEAQASGIPVVCSDAGGLPENVSHGETAFVVARRDPRAAAHHLVALAGDGQLRHRLGAAGQQRARVRYRLDDQIDSFDRLYREVLSSNAR